MAQYSAYIGIALAGLTAACGGSGGDGNPLGGVAGSARPPPAVAAPRPAVQGARLRAAVLAKAAQVWPEGSAGTAPAPAGGSGAAASGAGGAGAAGAGASAGMAGDAAARQRWRRRGQHGPTLPAIDRPRRGGTVRRRARRHGERPVEPLAVRAERGRQPRASIRRWSGPAATAAPFRSTRRSSSTSPRTASSWWPTRRAAPIAWPRSIRRTPPSIGCVAENAKQGGDFFGKIDLDNIAVMGHSLGSLASFATAAQNPHVATSVHFSGGLTGNPVGFDESWLARHDQAGGVPVRRRGRDRRAELRAGLRAGPADACPCSTACSPARATSDRSAERRAPASTAAPAWPGCAGSSPTIPHSKAGSSARLHALRVAVDRDAAQPAVNARRSRGQRGKSAHSSVISIC